MGVAASRARGTWLEGDRVGWGPHTNDHTGDIIIPHACPRLWHHPCKWLGAWSVTKIKNSVYGETKDSKPTWYAVHHRHTAGVFAIPDRWRFVRKCVGPCCIHCNCEGSNPVLDVERTPRLFLPYNSYITNDPSIDHTVVATARVGHWLGRGWAGHWIGDVTIHSFDRPVRARNDRARPHSHVARLYDPCTNCGRGRWWPWHWRWRWSSLGSPALPRPPSGTKTGALGTFDTDHWAWTPRADPVRGWDTVDTSGWYRP